MIVKRTIKTEADFEIGFMDILNWARTCNSTGWLEIINRVVNERLETLKNQNRG